MRDQTPGHDWIEEFKEGKEWAFKKVYDEFFYPLCYFAFKLIHSQPEAEEIAADSLHKLMRDYQKMNDWWHIRNFLYLVTRTRCSDLIKSRTRKQPSIVPLEDETIVDNEELVLNLLIKTEMMEAIYQEIEQLPRLRREVFALFYIEGLTMDEIARRLGTNVNVIRSTKSKAAAQLRALLGPRKFLLLITWLLIRRY